MALWFWHKANETQPRGPVTEERLRELARYDELQRIDRVWRAGWEEWVPAHTVPGLFDAMPSLPPPVPEFAGGGGPMPTGPGPAGAAHVAAGATAPTWSAEGVAGSVAAPYPDRLRGVGGWLSFFCVSITILSPLVTCGQLLTGWEEAKPAFEIYPSVKTAMIVEIIFTICVVLYGIVAGILILSGRKDGKEIAEHYLIISFLVFILG
ncbi:MAG TPA: DUF4339 domain-containing protein [Rhodothermales bacterium]|nr:DUF4339 domain-containing protein [Rhodothermales bacterium]